MKARHKAGLGKKLNDLPGRRLGKGEMGLVMDEDTSTVPGHTHVDANSADAHAHTPCPHPHPHARAMVLSTTFTFGMLLSVVHMPICMRVPMSVPMPTHRCPHRRPWLGSLE